MKELKNWIENPNKICEDNCMKELDDTYFKIAEERIEGNI